MLLLEAGSSPRLELDSVLAGIVAKQNPYVEAVVEAVLLQQGSSAAAENLLLPHSTKDRMLRHWDQPMIFVIVDLASAEQSEHTLAVTLEQSVLLAVV